MAENRTSRSGSSRRRALLAVAGLTALTNIAALPFAAHAAVLGTIKVNSGYVSGSLSAPGTQRWRIYLEENKRYAVHGDTGEEVEGGVRAADGTVLASFEADGDLENDGGVSFKAPYTGFYTVVVTTSWPNFPVEYSLAADSDCAGGKSTRCGIGVGQTLDDLKLSYIGDDDWFKASVQAGRRYTASLSNVITDLSPPTFSVFDSSGRHVGKRGSGGISFKAQYTGPYYLAVGAHADGTTPGTYSLSLRAN